MSDRSEESADSDLPAFDIAETLRANADQARAVEAARPPPEDGRNHRKWRDYGLLLAAGNGVLLAPLLAMPINLVTLLFGGSGAILYTIGLTWVYVMVLSEY